MSIDIDELMKWIKEKATEHNETLDLFEKHNEVFGKEWLEGKVSGLREVYFHIIKNK